MTDSPATPTTSPATADDADLVIPIVQERAVVAKHERTTGRVRISTEVQTRTEHVETDLVRQDIQILRVPVNRPIDAVPDVRMEGEVMVYPIVEEVVVVTKQLMLKEELRVSRKRTIERHGEDVTLSRTEAVVERLPGEG